MSARELEPGRFRVGRTFSLAVAALLVGATLANTGVEKSEASATTLGDSTRNFDQIIQVGDGSGEIHQFGSIEAKVTLGDLASRTQQRPYTSIVDKGGETQEIFGRETNPDGTIGDVYTFLTDKDYNSATNGYGQRNEGFEGATTNVRPRVATVDDGDRQIVTVESQYSISCSRKNNSNSAGYSDSDSRFCSIFGPEIWSNAFPASAGEALSFEYKAQSADQYEPYGFLVRVTDMGGGNYSFGGANPGDPERDADPAISVSETHQIVLYARGQDTTDLGGWLPASGDVPADGHYRFRFVNGTFDGTGGGALGAAFQVDVASIEVALSQTVTFPNPGDQVGDSGSLDISATSSAGLNITYATTSSDKCAFSSDGNTTTATAASGASVTLFKLSQGDCNLTARASGNGTYAAAGLKTASFEILPSATRPVNNVTPQISGTVAAGSTLSVSEGGSDWSNGGSAITSTTYQWISTLAGVTSNIAGATASSFCVPESLVGATLKVEVTKTNGEGPTSAESSSTVAIASGTACPVQDSGQTGNSGGNDDDEKEEENTPPATTPGGVTENSLAATSRRGVAPPQTSIPVIRQGPVLRDGVVPRDVRTPEVRIGGRTTSVQSKVTDPSNLSVRAGAVSLGVQVQRDEGSVSQSDDGTTEITVRKGARTTLSGEGLRPESTVQVFLPLEGANAKELTRIPVGLDGSFSGDAVFATQRDQSPLPVGRQVLQLVSVDGDGNEVVVDMTVNIAQPPPAPELNRVEGVIPTLTPGSSIATNAGVPEQVRVSAMEEQKLAVVEGDGWSMAIGVAAEDGGVQATEGGASLTLVRNESARVSGNGFMPGTRADVWLFSEPTLLGTVTIDDDGRFDGEVNIDGRVIAVGNHTLQLQGVGQDGYVRAANMGVVVGDAASVAPTTMEQSISFIWWIALLVVLVVLTVALLARRRRKQS